MVLWFLIFVLLVQLLVKSSSDKFLRLPQPAPHTKTNRILSVLLSHNLNHYESVTVILKEYVAMCESGWSPHVVLMTHANYTIRLQKLVSHVTFCSRAQVHIPVSFETNYNLSLSRRYFADHLDEADVFIYQEDDMILRLSQVNEWLRQMYILNDLLPANEMQDRTVGFLRYRRDNPLHPPHISAKDSNARDAQEEDLIKLEYIEEEPAVGYICLGSNQSVPYLFFGGNCHQALWIFVREQIDYLQAKCSFLNQTKPESSGGWIEYMSDMSIWDKHGNKHNPLGGCGLQKMAPPEVERIAVQHYYPGARRTLHWYTLYNEVRRVYVGNRAFKGRIPSCWENIVKEAQREEARGI